MLTLRRVKSPVRISFIFLLAIMVPSLSSSREVTLGKLDFPTSGTPEAQQEFVQGMLYMHSFEYDPAAVAFRKSQAIDPDFAMAYWGEAMTNHHSLWRVQHQQAAQDVLNKLGKTSKERAAKAPTQREKNFIHAAEILFGMTEETKGLDKLERDVHYRNAMKRLHMSYPDDLEARVLYGLSILGVGSANREYATYMQAAAIITPVWDANRAHPGAAHYLIHSYDDPVHAILGLPMARAYEKIAVDAAHAQHMTSHIYVALGLWDDMIGANVTALSVESAKTVGEGSRSREAWHHRYWLHYGRLQQGRLDEAREILTMARDRISDKARDLLPKIQMGGKEANPEIILSQKEVDILKLEVQSVIAMKEGDGEKAVTMAREATEMQASLPFRYGPPRISKPTAELLGDISYELGDDAGAILAYQDQLSRSKLRTNSLIGLARATARIGDDTTSQEAYDSLANIWHSADESVTGLAEVKRLTRRN